MAKGSGAPIRVLTEIGGRALLYARTARHLQARQWLHRSLRVIRPRARLASTDESADLSSTDVLAAEVVNWPHDAAQSVARADGVCAAVFRFLNRSERLPTVDWGRRYVTQLWTYHLHYFDYAVDLALAWRATGDRRFADRFAILAREWDAAARAQSVEGLDPYPTSIRIVNWLRALWLFGDALSATDRAVIARSVVDQLALLERNVEWDLAANHLHKNLHALTVGGLAFAGRRACTRRAVALNRLWRELRDQILPDGGHCEQSPMYHLIALNDCLELFRLLRAASIDVPPDLNARVQLMARAAGALVRPDGTLHLFGDSANGVAPTLGILDAHTRALFGTGIEPPSGTWSLPHTGYFGHFCAERCDRFIVDCGPTGATYQPAHAHCDVLSFELDIAGRPVIVDSGVSGYAADPLREYARSTRAHSTVVIDGRDQSEIWSTFRMARRARVRSAGHSSAAGQYRFQGCYSPYHSAATFHSRVITRERETWTVTDTVSSIRRITAIRSYVHIHPRFSVAAAGQSIVATDPAGSVRIEPFGVHATRIRKGELDPVQGWYCPEFGQAIPAPVIEFEIPPAAHCEFGFLIGPG